MAISSFLNYKLFTATGKPKRDGSLIDIPISRFERVIPPNNHTNAVDRNYPISFNFIFDEILYQRILISACGFFCLTNTTNVTDALPPEGTGSANLNQDTEHPIIAPWWDSLVTTPDYHPQPTSGGVFLYSGSYGLDGHKILCIRWHTLSNTLAAGAKKLFFEAVLHDNSNTIEFNYAPFHNISGTDGTSAAVIGINRTSGRAREYDASLFRCFTINDYLLGGSITSQTQITVASNWPAGSLSASNVISSDLSSNRQTRYVFAPKNKILKVL